MNIFKSKILTREDILLKYTEEDIFSLVLGYKPEEGDILCSPLRVDTNPGCTFRYYNNWLQFLDFGSKDISFNKKKVSYDCFSFIAAYYNIHDDQYLLNFILKSLEEKNIPQTISEKRIRVKNHTYPYIAYKLRDYLIWDVKYWTEQYGITIQNLQEDKVYPISSFTSTINNITKKYDFFTLGYVYTDFNSNNVKIYLPKNKMRFYTNCDNNDIGGINSVDYSKDKIVITKSYKDYRVLKNNGINCIWFQNEGAFPDLEILLPFSNKFKEVIIFFDNDNTGSNTSEILFNILSAYSLSTIKKVELIGEDKDPSDLIKNKGQQKLVNFLITNKLM